jgi:hypothetical protein
MHAKRIKSLGFWVRHHPSSSEVTSWSWRHKFLDTRKPSPASQEICTQLTLYSPSPTLLLPTLTLSAGEHKVSGGKFEASRPGNLPRSKPQNGGSCCRYLRDRCTGVLFGVHNPGCLCLFHLSCVISSTTIYLLYYLRQTATLIVTKRLL